MQKKAQAGIIIFIIAILLAVYFSSQKSTKPLALISPPVEETYTEVSKENANTNQTLTIIRGKSQIQWTGSKQIGASHTGLIQIKSGEIVRTGTTITGGEFVIDMKTISVTDLPEVSAAQLVEHLNNDDFFAVNTYPEATLVITNAKSSDQRNYVVQANLTIKGKTHPITFNAKQITSATEITVQANIDIDRTLWGIQYGSGKFFDNLGDQMIKDMLAFDVTLGVKNPFKIIRKDNDFTSLNSRIEGSRINIEKVSIELVEYRGLNSRIEGGTKTVAQNKERIQTEYKSLSSRIE